MPMRKFLQFLFFSTNIFIVSSVFSQSKLEVLRIDYPKYVQINSMFNISTVFKFNEIPEKISNFQLKKNNNLEIVSAYIFQGDKKRTKLSFISTKNDVDVIIDPSEFDLISGKAYQLVLNSKISKPVKLNKELIWQSNEEVNYLDKDLNANALNKEFLLQAYKPGKTAGEAVRIANDGFLKIELNKGNHFSRVFSEFWLKNDQLNHKLLNLVDKSTNKVLVTLIENEFGFLKIAQNETIIDDNEIYLGKSNWDYFSILAVENFGNININIYLNTQKMYSFSPENISDISQIAINFIGDERKNNIELDRFKIWEYNNSLELADREKHFLNYDADSSNLLYSTNFEDRNEFNEIINSDKIRIEAGNLSYTKSSAPLFSKAPKLTVTMGSSYNSIVWYVQEYSFAKEFVLEKAVKDGEFQEVYKTYADDDPLKIYYYTDEILDENEVAFYRIKQINKDGSNVSSAEVKIGHNNIAEFNLSQNYPNPFNPLTNIYVDVVIPAKFEVKVYDLVGNIVDELYKGYLSQGMHTFEFDGSSLPSGIYFYEVLSPKAQIVKKMILAK